MNVTEIKKNHHQINFLIAERQLKTALKRLRECISKSQHQSYISELGEISFAYNNMLTYLANGTSDPDRKSVYDKLISQLYDLNDDWADDELSMQISLLRFDTRHRYDIVDIQTVFKQFVSAAEIRKLQEHNIQNIEYNYYKLLDDVFNIIWSCNPTAQLFAAYKETILNKEVDIPAKAALAGAICTSLSQRFSLEYAMASIEMLQSNISVITARGGVNVLLSLINNYDRWSVSKPLMATLDIALDNGNISRDLLFDIFLNIIRTKENKQIEYKVKHEITPEILKAKDILNDRRGLEGIVFDENGEPDWSELFEERPKLKSSMEQLSRWQNEGADIFLPTFRYLKHYNFFEYTSNWFTPFSISHPILVDELKNESESLRINLAQKIRDTNALCDSDKYSLLLSFCDIPTADKEKVCEMYNLQFEQESEIKDGETVFASEKIVSKSNQYVQDLYRFYNLHPHRSEFSNIFRNIDKCYESKAFEHLFGQNNYMEKLGEFYVLHNLYNEGKDVFIKLLGTSNDILLLRKIAFCAIKCHEHDIALEYLLRADLIDPENTWTKKQIARCYVSNKKYSLALKYFNEADLMDPNNLKIKTAISNCLIGIGDYDGALKILFYINYNKPNNAEILRTIAFCSFALSKFEKAIEYSQQIDSENRIVNDILIQAHSYLCCNNYPEAMAKYRQCLKMLPPIDRETTFINLFKSNSDILHKSGINDDIIPLIIDCII